ncbi:MAG: hypothetical protein JWQ06_1302 [Mucilaginibacter sp.]|nr:hypothetical protein [Mucilaginibacter sp.]
MKKFKLLLFFAVFFCFKSFAQSFYVNAPDPYNVTLGTVIYRVTKSGSSFVSQLINTCYPGDQFFSIAMNKNGFYWLDGNQMFTGTISGNSLTNCKPLCSVPMPSNALTIGSDGKLYYSGSSLYSTDPATLQSNNLGPMFYWPYGDLTFYNGDLYMASGGSIVKVDTKNPSASSPYISTGNLIIYGLVAVPANLHKNTVYALVYVDSFSTNIVEIDMDNKVVLGVVGTLPYGILDAASITEDGSISGIQINNINIHQDCNTPTKGIIEVITKPSLAPLTYELSNGVSNTTGVFTGVSQGTYQLKITSSVDEQDTIVNVPAYTLIKPTYTYNISNQDCDVPGQVTFSTPDNSNAYSVSLGTGSFPINHTFTGLTNTSSYHFNIINAGGCIVDSLTINIPRNKCRIQVNTTTVLKECNAVNKGSIQVLTQAHKGTYTYKLNEFSDTTGIFNMLDPGKYVISIISSEDTLLIPAVVPDYKLIQPAISFIANNPACAAKGNITFSVQNSGLYKIKLGTDTLPSDHVFGGLTAGTYHFVILTQQGCMVDEYDVALQYQPCPVVIDSIKVTAECNILGKGIIQIICEPIPETYSYTLNNSITNSTGVFNLLDPGTYQLLISTSGGGISQNRTVIVPDFSLNKPITVINQSNPVCELPGQIKFTIDNNSTLFNIQYNSSVYPSNYIFTGLLAGEHHFSILKKNGCIVDAIAVNLIQEACNPVSFPSAFTPNYDGINDIFRANPQSKATNFRLQIYDRWGALLFTSFDLYGGWNGEYKGKPVSMGTYYWIATFTTQENKPATQSGYVALIR